MTHQKIIKYAFFHVSSVGADNYISFESNSKESWPKIWEQILDRFWQIERAEKVIIVKIVPFRANSFVWHKIHLMCQQMSIMWAQVFTMSTRVDWKSNNRENYPITSRFFCMTQKPSAVCKKSYSQVKTVLSKCI